MHPKLIAETSFELKPYGQCVARIFAPERDAEGVWSCRITAQEPIGVDRLIHGETSLQALCLGLKVLSAYLYSSDAYARGEIGFAGEFGGDLLIPATQPLLDRAPYPF